MLWFKAFFRFILFAVVAVVISCFQSVVLLFTKGRLAYILPWLWHWLMCRIFSLRVHVDGAPASQRQVIFMANHLSYLDIPVLGALIKGSFVAKEDVQSWAVFGFLSKLQQTAYISRRRGAAKTVQAQLDRLLGQGKDLILFPEGTSTDGRDVYPFKSSLFSLILGSQVDDLVVQPVTIQVTSTDGQPVTRESEQALLDLYSWHINMETPLGEHLWLFAQTSGADIHVCFHEPLSANAFNNRKDMAKSCHDVVRGGLV